MKKHKRIILKPWFIAVVPAVAIILLLPDLFNKYEISVIHSGSLVDIGNKPVIEFHDMDNDGISEQILSYSWNGLHSLQVITYDGGIVDQWNMTGDIASGNLRFINGDFDNDHFDEIYPFSQNADTIYINCFEPFDTVSPISFKNKKICTLSHKYAEPDYEIHDGHFVDLNTDRWKDLVFSITSGYAKFPRNIFVYDIKRDTLLISPKIGTYLYDTKIVDLGDGKHEIIGNTTAGGNIDDSICPFSDYSAWILAFDTNLDFIFKPIEFPGFRSQIDVEPVALDGIVYLAALYNNRGQSVNKPSLLLLNSNGDIIRESNLPLNDKNARQLVIQDKNDALRIYVVEDNGTVNVYDKNFNLIKNVELNRPSVYFAGSFDLDNDSLKENILISNKKLLITSDNFQNIVEFKTEVNLNSSRFSLIYNGTNKPSMYFYDNERFVELEYFKNPFYYAKFPIYLGIYFLIWIFILLIRRLQLIQIQKQESIRNQIANLQLKSFKNQIDPHFTFNVFNTMAQRIKSESPSLHNSFMEFTNLIRTTLVSSDSITRTMEDEISHLKSYLELEKLRFPDKLQYEIKVDNAIDLKTRIPKMLLQTYVENGIKHGIRHKGGHGKISIRVSQQDVNLLFTIKDDGIGRKKAKEFSADSTGLGLKLMENYFSLFNEYNETKIRHQIIDLYNEQNNPVGTEVRILIPLNFNYKLKRRDK